MNTEQPTLPPPEPHLATLLQDLERVALARGMCMVAHFIGCARMVLEEDAAQFSPGSRAIN